METVEEVEFSQANYFLFDMYNHICFQGPLFLLLNNTSVKVYCIYFKSLGITGFYINRKTNLQVLGTDALLRVSRLQYGPTLMPYGPVTEQDVLRYAFLTSEKSFRPRKVALDKYWLRSTQLGRWFNTPLEPPRTKISARHLRHLTIHELRQIGLDYFLDRIPEVVVCLAHLSNKDLHESMLAGILVWATILPESAQLWNRVSGIWTIRYKSVSHFSETIKKNFSLRLKALQNLVPLDLTPFFELEVLVNRGVGNIDWSTERINRTKPNLAEVPPHILYPIVTNLFRTLENMGARPEVHEWDSFWAERWKWAPTGAYHSQYEADLEVLPKDPGLRNKFYCLNATGKREFSYFYNRKPETVAWPSKKYEWGKERAIYGVDLTNFVLSSFGMAGCEKVLEQMFPIGSTASDTHVTKTVKEVLKNGIPFCFDFEDFNSQHSFEAMDIVLGGYLEVFGTRLSYHQRLAVEWLRHANKTTTVLGVDGVSYQTKGTLLSGWRLTTFMNTVLNYAYTKACMQGDVLVSTHNGDDILAAVSSFDQVQKLVSNAQTYKIRFQKTKCFLGSIAEFLRVDHRTGTGAQYLARAVSTFVHGPTETVLPNNLFDILQAMYTRKTELLERKAAKDIVDLFFSKQVSYTAYKWAIPESRLYAVLDTHISKGGLSETISNTSLEHKVEIVRYKDRERIQKTGQEESGKTEDELDKERLYREYSRNVAPGVLAFTKKVVRKFGLEAYETKIKKAATHAILGRAVINRYTLFTSKSRPVQTDILRASQYGMYRHKLAGAKVTLAKTYKIPIFAIKADMNSMAEIILGASDPIAAMQLWL